MSTAFPGMMYGWNRPIEFGHRMTAMAAHSCVTHHNSESELEPLEAVKFFLDLALVRVL